MCSTSASLRRFCVSPSSLLSTSVAGLHELFWLYVQKNSVLHLIIKKKSSTIFFRLVKIMFDSKLTESELVAEVLRWNVTAVILTEEK